jgi:hypothetical protein
LIDIYAMLSHFVLNEQTTILNHVFRVRVRVRAKIRVRARVRVRVKMRVRVRFRVRVSQLLLGYSSCTSSVGRKIKK